MWLQPSKRNNWLNANLKQAQAVAGPSCPWPRTRRSIPHGECDVAAVLADSPDNEEAEQNTLRQLYEERARGVARTPNRRTWRAVSMRSGPKCSNKTLRVSVEVLPRCRKSTLSASGPFVK